MVVKFDLAASWAWTRFGGRARQPVRRLAAWLPGCRYDDRPAAVLIMLRAMAAVDPDDDSIQRWVVWHYRFDPERKQRRNVVVAAFDEIDEFHADIEQRAAKLRDRKERDETVDPAERIGGRLYEPGHQRLQRNAHLVARAIKRGVTPPGLEDLDLPSNVSSAQAHRLE